MQNIITLDVLCATSEKGFSLDELILRIKDLFETQGMAGFASLVLQLIDEKICMEMVKSKTDSNKQCCCLSPQYSYHDRLERRLRTSVGQAVISWHRLKCSNCGKTIIPLRQFLGLEPYQSKTSELEKLVTQIVSEQSYRRSSSHLQSIGGIPVPRSTAHRWVVQSDCDQIDSGNETFDLLFADGTGYKRRVDKESGIDNKGQLRIALGVDKSGQIVPLGAFSGKSWDDIAVEVKGQRPDDKPVADMFVSDGEAGLIQNMGSLCSEQQRCHWHLVRELCYKMWQDKVGKSERRQMQKELAAMIGIEVPQEDIEQVCDEDKETLSRSVNEAERDVGKLIARLLNKGYQMAGDYLIRAAKNMFSYIRYWLKTGIVTPHVSSMIERMMRELARRLKRMAFGWSEDGAAKMARIIIKRFTSAGQWDKYWRDKLRIQDNVMLVLVSIKSKNPQPLGR